MEERFVVKGVSNEAIDSALAEVWQALLRNPETREKLASSGIDQVLLNSKRPPFVVKADGDQIGIAETIVIAVASGAATQLGKKAADMLWKLLKPEVLRKFGARLTEILDSPRKRAKKQQ